MGKKIDALLGRNFKSFKFNPLVNRAISRLAVLRNQRQARCSLARSDVVQLLNLSNHDRALLRVEQVIKDQNMLDVFVIMEGYCHLFAERINLIEQERICHEELKEAVSSMIYASTRCGDFPELQEMRDIFTSQFGKDFVARATELRNNCGVNLRMIQKLSTRQPSMEIKLKVLKEIASDNNIVLQMEEDSSTTKEDKLETQQRQHRPMPDLSTNSGCSKAGDNSPNFTEEIEDMEGLSDSMKGTRKYKDVADAAQAAFKSAAYAAAAARAAVELSRSESQDPDDQSGHSSGKRRVADEHGTMKSKVQTTEGNNSRGTEDENARMGFEKVHSIQKYNSDSDDEEIQVEKRAEESEHSKTRTPVFYSDSDSDSNEDVSEETRMHLDVVGDQTRSMEPVINNDESDNESETIIKQGVVQLSRTHDVGLDMKPVFLVNEDLGSKKSNVIADEDLSQRDDAKPYQPQKRFSLRSQIGLKARLRAWKPENWSISANTGRAQGC